MTDVFQQIRRFMEKEGIPGRDLWDLPSSTSTFPDGSHWRIEIAGIERASTMEALVDEANKRKTIVHRIICTVGGSTYCDFEELKTIARIANQSKIEAVMTIGHRKGWDPGAKESVTYEGAMQGFRLRGSDNICYFIADMMRNVEAGFRAFLIYDEGVLNIVNKMRKEGLLPCDTIFKFSVFGGYCSAAGAKVVEAFGANSINPSSDVSLPILASIRKAVNLPIDVYISVVDSFGGMFRAYEAPEIARVASPCYFKFEPGTSEGEIYKPWVSEEYHKNFIRQKIKMASIVCELMDRHAPNLKMSDFGPKELAVPIVA